MVSQNATVEKPSRYDGLTKTERQHLYAPGAYDVTTPDNVNFAAVNRENGAAFHVICAYGRFYSVTSNTGNTYDLEPGMTCPCHDYERGLSEGRRCKHVAAAEAVEYFQDRRSVNREMAAEMRRRNPQIARDAERLGQWIECGQQVAAHVAEQAKVAA